MNGFTLYHADCVGMETNCIYPHKVLVTDDASLREAAARDYVCVQYKRNYRSNDNFTRSDCLGMDCDNDHSENPDDWVTPDHIRQAFPDTTFAVHFSRHHNIPKRGKPPRPKFHVLFLIEEVTDHAEYSDLKKRMNAVFPYFDMKALDAARFFFGTAEPEAAFFPGTITLDECLDMYYPDSEADAFRNMGNPSGSVISEGSRNATLSHFAGRVLKRYGDTETAYNFFLDEADKCDPPLEDAELSTIWRSAQGFYSRISQQEGYVPPDEYNADTYLYKPEDYTDVGQARMLGEVFHGELRYSPATDYIHYNGTYWRETKPGAQHVAHALTDLQLAEAQQDIQNCVGAYEDTGAAEIMAKHPKKKATAVLNDEQLQAYQRYEDAASYKSFALQRRESKYITATLHEARPVLEIDPALLDKDWYLLCTPAATYDLRRGLAGAQAHNPEDFITHATAASPSEKGKKLWLDALNTFFSHDEELIRYVQRVAGVVCVGQVFWEVMIIAYGDGRNGKSTFWNTLARVLGDYSGNISADALTVGCRRNVKPEMAETRGKRLLIAAELEEGTRLNTSTVKQLTSTDNVYGEKKYKDPLSFTPSHTLVLYTNHLPKVGAMDSGIWRRLVVIPFTAKIEGNSDIKNYADHLFENAREAVMAWMIEGAQEAIELGFKIPLPARVQRAIEAYREQSDWLNHFLTECCEVGPGLEAKSGELYTTYRSFCTETGEYIRSTTDFYAALEAEDFNRHKKRSGIFVNGLRLVDRTFNDDFLQ
ncbi:phage/plasmid primase, P4 family [Bacillota bacterium Meth-B3]